MIGKNFDLRYKSRRPPSDKKNWSFLFFLTQVSQDFFGIWDIYFAFFQESFYKLEN